MPSRALPASTPSSRTARRLRTGRGGTAPPQSDTAIALIIAMIITVIIAMIITVIIAVIIDEY